MVTTRAVLIGALVATAWAAISTYSDHYARLTWGFGWGSLPAGPVALAFLVVLANGVLKRLSPRRALSLSEVLIVYSILTLATALIVANTPYMLPIAAYPHYHARVAVWWDTTILNYLPSWLHPKNPEQIAWFWEGVPAGTPIPWGDWLAPVAGWGSFAAALMVAMLCLGTLLRKDWIERQRLTFPLTEIPMAMVGEEAQPTLGRSAFGQRMFWVGFGLSGALIVLVWLNRLYPSVPAPDLFQQLGQSFAGAGLPWSALSFLVVRIAPATIGVMCLVPGEISFSLWAFFVLYCLYLVVCGSFGLPPEGSQAMGSFHPRAFAEYACSGGFVVVAAMALYQSRDAFAVGLRALLKRQREADDPVAPMTNGAALLGFVAANGFMLWWALAAGMSWWSFALIMMACYVSMIGTSRLVAAAGLLQARPAVNTRWTVLRMVGADAIGPRSLVMYNYLTMGFWLEPQNFGIVYLNECPEADPRRPDPRPGVRLGGDRAHGDGAARRRRGAALHLLPLWSSDDGVLADHCGADLRVQGVRGQPPVAGAGEQLAAVRDGGRGRVHAAALPAVVAIPLVAVCADRVHRGERVSHEPSRVDERDDRLAAHYHHPALRGAEALPRAAAGVPGPGARAASDRGGDGGDLGRAVGGAGAAVGGLLRLSPEGRGR
jgi:hypothetical protein